MIDIDEQKRLVVEIFAHAVGADARLTHRADYA